MIKVIDSMCGTGKSTKMFEIMKKQWEKDPHTNFLYISLRLSEIEERIPQVLPELNFKSPINKGSGKLEGLKQLVERCENIASTHVLFSHLTVEIVDMLIARKYFLVIDEALSCVGLLDKTLVPTDTRDLLKSGMVKVNESQRSRVEWNEEEYPVHDGRYSFVRDLCNLGVVYCYNDTFLMYEYPPKILRDLPEVYVLTYLFQSSDMRCWLQLNDIPYEILDNKELGLISEEDIKEVIKENLEILEGRSLLATKQRANTLSRAWYKASNREEKDKYKGMLRSCVVTHKAKAGDVFWTTFKDYQKNMQGTGYTKGVSDDMPAFLPLNTRATNDYRDYWLCMYTVNLFKNPIEVNYLKHNGIEVEEDMYSLSEMIQFIWRGCIRQHKPMKVLVLSTRMRNLLKQWLYGDVK